MAICANRRPGDAWHLWQRWACAVPISLLAFGLPINHSPAVHSSAVDTVSARAHALPIVHHALVPTSIAVDALAGSWVPGKQGLGDFRLRMFHLWIALAAESLLILLLLRTRSRWKRGEQERAYALKLESLLAGLAASLITLTPRMVSDEIEKAFKRLLEVHDLDRVSLFEFSEGTARLRLLFSRKTANALPSLSVIDLKENPWISDHLLQGKPMIIASPMDLPEEALSLRKVLLHQDIRSFAVLPLKANGVVIGALSFACVRYNVGWNPELVHHLEAVADIFGNALMRVRAEEALHASEDKFRQFFTNLPEYGYILSSTQQILDVNPAACEAMGYRREELVGKSLSFLYAPESIGELRSLDQRWNERGRLVNEEMVVITKSGERRTVLLNAGTAKDTDGKLLHSTSVQVDITERKRAEEALQKSEEKFSKAFRESPLMVTLLSAKDHRLVDVNEAFERLSGYNRKEVIGRTALELGIWEDLHQLRELNRRMLSEGGKVQNMECHYRRRNGERLIGLLSSEIIEIDGENYNLAVTTDITDRKQAEDRLRESEERFRKLADDVPVAIWMHDVEKRLVYINKAGLDFSGLQLESCTGRPWLDLMYPPDAEKNRAAFEKAVDARQQFTFEYRDRHVSGKYRWLVACGMPRFLPNRDFTGYIGISMDIHDRKEAEQARLELSGRLIHAQEEERSRIARELHDDISQKLALLAIALQQMDQELPGLEEGVRRKIGKLWQQTNDVATDVQHLSHQLHSSKLQHLGLTVAARSLCREFATQHKMAVEFTVRDMPGVVDEELALCLFRVLQELLHNVAKHSGAARVNAELAGEEGRIRLQLSDDGIGFDPESDESWHGLGLFSMRERLSLVGGHLSIESKPLLGTRIEAVVPISRTDNPSAGALLSDPAAAGVV